MPLYDCGQPDCLPCEAAFRRKEETVTTKSAFPELSRDQLERLCLKQNGRVKALLDALVEIQVMLLPDDPKGNVSRESIRRARNIARAAAREGTR